MPFDQTDQKSILTCMENTHLNTKIHDIKKLVFQ